MFDALLIDHNRYSSVLLLKYVLMHILPEVGLKMEKKLEKMT